MKREELKAQIASLIAEYDGRQENIQATYEAKWSLAETAKEHLAINEWHDTEMAKLNRWYWQKSAFWLVEPIED